LEYLAQNRRPDEDKEEEKEENPKPPTPIAHSNPVRIFYFMRRSLLPFQTRSLNSDRLLN
jgi:hypothetical protein